MFNLPALLRSVRERVKPPVLVLLGSPSQAATLCAALGDTLSAEFIRLKRDEWQAYGSHISDWEMQRYAAAF